MLRTFKEEGEMLKIVKQFLINEKGCLEEYAHYDDHKGAVGGRRLSIKSKFCSNPDVYGMDEGGRIYFCQGKNTIGGLWALIGQGISNLNRSHFTYLFVPHDIFKTIRDEPDWKGFLDQLEALNLGLLVVNKIEVIEILAANETNLDASNVKPIQDRLKLSTNTWDFITFVEDELNLRLPLFHKGLGRNNPILFFKPSEDYLLDGVRYVIKFTEPVRIGINGRS